MISFIGYILVYILLPGLALFSLTKGQAATKFSWNQIILISLITGLIVEIFVGLISIGLLKYQILIVKYYPIIFIAFLLYELLRKKLHLPAPVFYKSVNRLLEWGSLLGLAFVFIWLEFYNDVKLPAWQNTVYLDLLYFQDMIALWVQDLQEGNFQLRVPGKFEVVTLKYHHFTYLHRTLAAFNSGLSAELINFRYDLPFIVFVLVLSVREISSKLSSKWYFSVICFFSIFLMHGFWYIYALRIHKIFIYSPSYAYSLIFLFAIISLVINKVNIRKYFWVYLLVFIMMLGSKGSNIVIIIPALGLYGIYNYLHKLDYKPIGYLVLGFILVAFLQFWLQFRGEAQTPDMENALFSIINIPDKHWLFSNYFFSHILKRVLDFRVFFPFVIVLALLMYNNFRLDRRIAFLSAMYLVCLGFFFTIFFVAFVHPNNVAYFYLNIIIAGVFILLYYIIEYKPKIKSLLHRMVTTIVIVILAANIVGIILRIHEQLRNPFTTTHAQENRLTQKKSFIDVIDFLRNDENKGEYIYLKPENDPYTWNVDYAKKQFSLGGFTSYNSIPYKYFVGSGKIYEFVYETNLHDNKDQIYIIKKQPDYLAFKKEVVYENNAFIIYLVK